MFKFLNLKDIEWKDAPRGYYLTDVKQHTLWEDKKTGATLALVKFPKGVADKIHSHPEALQITIGLSGEVEMPNGIMPMVPNIVITAEKGIAVKTLRARTAVNNTPTVCASTNTSHDDYQVEVRIRLLR
jgi:hypothetical protein